jgi:acetyl esterase/lipase
MTANRIKWDFENVSYGHDVQQKLDMICCNEKNVYAIVYIHGGAYLTGNKSQFPSFLLDYSKNNIFATIDYRVITENNNIQMADLLSDANNALEKIVELSSVNGVNIKGFILCGHSAGGHIALLCGYTLCKENKKIKVAACVSLAGPTDFTDDVNWSSMPTWGQDIKDRLHFFSYIGSRLTGHPIELEQANWTRQKTYSIFKKHILDISPISYVFKPGEMPPTLLIHAHGDEQVPYSNSIRLKSILDRNAVPNMLITPTGIGDNHMLGGIVLSEYSPIFFEGQSWVEKAKKWLAYIGVNQNKGK